MLDPHAEIDHGTPASASTQAVTLEIDGVDLGDILVAEGLAAPYRGGPRPDWCARGE